MSAFQDRDCGSQSIQTEQCCHYSTLRECWEVISFCKIPLENKILSIACMAKLSRKFKSK